MRPPGTDRPSGQLAPTDAGPQASFPTHHSAHILTLRRNPHSSYSCASPHSRIPPRLIRSRAAYSEGVHSAQRGPLLVGTHHAPRFHRCLFLKYCILK